MKNKASLSLREECYLLLLQSSLKSIPFNIMLAFILVGYLFYINIPSALVGIWLTAVCIIACFRWLNSFLALKNNHYLNPNRYSRRKFIILTSLMGATWGASYLTFHSYLVGLHEIVIILALGGTAAGSLAPLSIYLPAYYAYLLPMLLPVISYNFYSMQPDRIVLAVMYTLFMILMVITAKITSNLLQDAVKLARDKDNLIQKLKKLTLAQKKSLAEINRLSITDSLTGLFNRRYFEIKLQDEFNRASRNDYPLNLVFIDVDNFKHINDNFGHPYGDLFLKHLAEALIHSTKRANDSAFRIGGDEFAAIFSNTSLEEVISLCSHIQKQFKHSASLDASISIGILCVPPLSATNIENLVSAADKTLYQAKKSGKNKIISQKFH